MDRENKTTRNSLVGLDTTTFDGEVVINGTLTVGASASTPFLKAVQAANVAEAAGDAPTAAEFKALLDALKTAGIMAAE